MDFVPDERATLSLRAIIIQQELEMVQLDATISRLKALLDDLRAQRASVRHSYDVNKAMLAPVRRLPPEMIGEIFVHCIPSHSSVPSFDQAPLSLMWVCRRWRQIAASTPCLWTKLDPWRGILNPYPIISLWLTNSGTLPIDFSMEPSSWSKNWGNYEYQAAFLAVENFHRFRRFKGVLGTLLYMALSRKIHPIHAPLLESFNLSFGSGFIPYSALKGCIRAPRLTTFSLQHTSMLDLISFHPLLRDIRLHGGRAPMEMEPQSLNFLPSYPNISCLHITLGEGMQLPTSGGHLRRVLLPCLEKLVVNYRPTNDPCRFFNAVEAPALRVLMIDPLEHRDEEEIPLLMVTLDSFLGRDSLLQELSLSGLRRIDSATYVSLLPRLRRLRCIDFRYSMVDDAILEALIPDPSSPPESWICPSLSTLTVMGTDLSRDLFLKLVRGRAPITADTATSGGTYLRHIDVRHHRGRMDESHIAALKEIARQCGGLLEIKC